MQLFHAVLYLFLKSHCFIYFDYRVILVYLIETRLKKCGGGKITAKKGMLSIELTENLDCVVFLVSLGHLPFKW